VGIASIGVAIHAAFALAGTRAAPVDDWLYCGLFILAAASCADRGRRDGGGPWILATVGVLIWGAAEIVFRAATPNSHTLYPGSTQAMLFVAFTLAYTTLALLARDRVRSFDPVLALDGALAGLAAAALAALLLFPVMHHAAIAEPPRLFLLGGVIGLGFVVTVLGMTGWRPGPSWAVLVVAIVVNVLGDVVLVHLANEGLFHRGSPADTLFVSSALLIGLAAFYPTGHAGIPHSPAGRLAAPLVSSVAAFAVVAAAVSSDVSGLAAGLALTCLALTIVRMSVAFELLESSRGEAMSDPLTGLGNRRRLMRDLESRLGGGGEPSRFTLALFDLDGFKRYNDTFGHPSGDALLVRLAGRLTSAVAPGVAYRMGGDEFCAILEGGGPGATAALARAHHALSERGDAFSIRSSSGVAACPGEGDTVRAALRIADARMYAAKTSRDLSQAQTRDAVLKMLQERDPPLHDHMRAVAALALRVAHRLGVDEVTAQQVERAAELHDIGKIAVPDAILHKAGALSDDERRFVREYPIVGERILRAAPSLAPVARLVRSCHERWDGSGYPDGLRHEEAPLGARIIAVCDAYHSMCSAHSYRRAHTRNQALGELRRCSGSQFDPAVVHALVAELENPSSRPSRQPAARRGADHPARTRSRGAGGNGSGGELRLSEVLSGLSHALDMTEGQARGHAERSCLIGMRLAGVLGLDDELRSSLFYALLLKDAGCSSNAAKVAALFGADDAVVKSSRRLTDTSSLPEAIRHAVRTAGAGSSPVARGRHLAAVLGSGRSGGRSLIELRCERGAAVVRGLGLGEVAAQAILDLDEHWDGEGYPAGIAGDQISLAGRVLCIAQTAEVFWQHGGPDAASEIVRRRRGSWFDPLLVDALLTLEGDEAFWDSVATPVVTTLEPPDRVLVADAGRLDQVAQAFASIVDAKSPYTAHHSDGVAGIAVALARMLGLDADTQATLRRAALLHDIGKLGVSNRILDKPGPLGPNEWETVRLHPRWSMEILARVRAFSDVARIAGAHHERLDGSGYHRGLTAEQLDAPSRILAVADVAEALSADRPYRRAYSPDEVLRMVRLAANRTLDADACAALEEVLPAWAPGDRENI
jgi:diguanylate cyclase (GGDEF)-like protein/putative nucleotidyltransferase with HDIG domain